MSHYIHTVIIPTAVHAAVYTLSGGLVTTLILIPFRKVIARITHKVWRAVDSLDPETDTGVTKQLKELEEKSVALDHHSAEHLRRSLASR